MTGAARLEAVGVGHTYRGRDGADAVVAIERVDLRVARHEIVAVVGPSGCGKSTLLAILAGLVTPTSGRVLIDGQVPGRLLGEAGHLPQQDLLMPWRTVIDNAALGVEINGVPRREARRRARGQLERFGLGGFGHRLPASLSGGMRQRTALLRTLLTGRDLLLLDEPFAALDALTRRDLHGWLLELARHDGLTIVLVTHDVDEAMLLADRVVVLSPRPGRVVLDAPVPLPRPRPREIHPSTELTALRRRLLEPLSVSAGAHPGAPA